ncbi:glycogen synthase GlgA [Temperatibacter marinus]|uniref:Glycogen synthase n=1 Tax=Temperatibacter marinus TaxID=1456591 RepID=A0AA52EEI1_9PROT|nr:glycogen synthase GlgA [Temperatibacter marinus]WND02188.1 glycogen synthase GlgA [Temperatibacter marinus]
MNILFVSSECYPLIKTGGLADVVGALPLAFDPSITNTTVFLPGFPDVLKNIKNTQKIAEFTDLAGGKSSLVKGTSSTGLNVIVMIAPHLFDLEGNPYVDMQGHDRAGNHIRYAAFSKAASDLSIGKLADLYTFDCVHAHDWQAGLTFAYLEAENLPKGPKRILTIHNLAFQGLFPKEIFAQLRLPSSMFSSNQLEYWGQVSYLKAGVVFSDHVTTVSPTYAAEIKTEELGMGFGGLLNAIKDRVSGITNGIDQGIWDPESDPQITASYSAQSLAGKALCKKALQEKMGLTRSVKKPLFCVISRLTTQKGLDLVLKAIPHLLKNGAQIAILGSGDHDLEHRYLEAADKYKGSVSTYIGYNEVLAHQVQAGADFILIPSRFEPCGLTQLCAMRYGTIPVVTRVGGLNDTVIDCNESALKLGLGTGIHLNDVTENALIESLDRSLGLFHSKKLTNKIRKNGMKQDLSWKSPAQAYNDLYSL